MPRVLTAHVDNPAGGDAPASSGARRLLDVLGRCAPALALAAWLAWATTSDLQLSTALRLLAALLLTQVLPGVLIWRTVRPRNGSWFEDLSMGFAIGSVFAIGTQTVAGTSHLPWLSTGIPLAAVIVLAAVPACRARILDAQTSWEPWWFGPLVSVATVAAIPQVVSYFNRVPMTWPSGFRQPHVDSYFHLALAGELANRGPVTFPWVASEPLAYHWFGHAWVANLSVVAGVELDQTLFRFIPTFLPLVVALIVATAAMRLTGKAWTGPVAAVLTFAGGDLNVFGQPAVNRPLDPFSPSLSSSVPILVALVVVLVCRWRGEARSGIFLLLPLLGIAAAGTKGSTLPLVVAGLGTAVGAAILFNRSRVRTLVLDLAMVLACLAFSVLVVFHGSDAGLRVDPRQAPEAAALFDWLGGRDAVTTNRARAFVTLVAMFGLLARGAGLLLLVTTRQGRRDPLTWLLAGGGLAGAGAIAVFAHPGDSQLYFAFSAIPLLALGSTVGLASLVDRLGAGALRPIYIGLGAGVLVVLLPVWVTAGPTRDGGLPLAVRQLEIAAAVLVLTGVLAALTLRPRRTALVGTVVVMLLAAGVTTVASTAASKPPLSELSRVGSKARMAVSRDQIEAARWIRDHSSITDRVMTNRHCSAPVAPYNCDTRRWVVAAFSERQLLLEGWTGVPRATGPLPPGRHSIDISYWKPELLALNDGFIARPDARAAKKLSGMGVRWVFVDFTSAHARNLEPFANLRYQNRWAAVYELPLAR